MAMLLITRLEKEHAQRMSSMTGQREKLEQSYRKDVEQLANRKSDLDKQLDIMQMKYKVGTYIHTHRATFCMYVCVYVYHVCRNEWRSFLFGKIKFLKSN